MKKYVYAWGEKYPILNIDMFARVVFSHSKIIGNSIPDYVCYVLDNKFVRSLYSQHAMTKTRNDYEKYFLVNNNLAKVKKYYEDIITQYPIFEEQLKKYNYVKLSDAKLHSLFKKYVNFTEKAYAIFRITREDSEIGPRKKIFSVLKKYYDDNEITEIYNILTESSKMNMVAKERLAWLKILRQPWHNKKIKKYIYTFSANFVNLYNISQITKLLKNTYKIDKQYIDKIEKEISNNQKHRRRLLAQQKAIYKHCKYNSVLIKYSRLLQENGIYRFKLKYLWAGFELRVLPFFREIAQRIGLNLEDFFDLYLVDDINSFFIQNKKLTIQELSNRKKCIFIQIVNKKYKVLSGNQGLKMVKDVEGTFKKTKQLKGITAFKGLAKGRARIVHATDLAELSKIAKKFKKGEILVTENTQPIMVVLMKKAGAIITEQGGVTSHAAIISREFKKPCVIAVENATKVLKDGDVVEVDANRGIIRKLK